MKTIKLVDLTFDEYMLVMGQMAVPVIVEKGELEDLFLEVSENKELAAKLTEQLSGAHLKKDELFNTIRGLRASLNVNEREVAQQKATTAVLRHKLQEANKLIPWYRSRPNIPTGEE